jgi:hypothetical protein
MLLDVLYRWKKNVLNPRKEFLLLAKNRKFQLFQVFNLLRRRRVGSLAKN